MTINFKTFGPFRLDDWSKPGIDNFYASVRNAHHRLENAVGVYIVAGKIGSKLLPLYVGRTDKGFGWRLRQHIDRGAFQRLHDEHRGLQFFLIARCTLKGLPIRKSSNPDKRLKSIERLEFALIGVCRNINPELENKYLKRFHDSLQVPGFWNSPKNDRDESAKRLAKLLGTQGSG